MSVSCALLEGFDDICIRCERLRKDPSGEGYSCPAAEDGDLVKSIALKNEAILRAVELKFKDVVRSREIFPLL